MIRPKGLGRGLDALLSGADEPSATELLQTLAIDRLRPGKYQPRTRMDEASLDELAQSIREHGIMSWLYEHVFGQHNFRGVPTADVNTTFALALSVFAMMIFYSIKIKGLGGWLYELLSTPFGLKPIWLSPLLVVFNLLFQVVEYVSKPLSHSLRLYGNMYAGEIIFILLGMWAATGVAGAVLSGVLHLGWSIFHILIVGLQAYIFMMLTIVYIAMAHEHH